MCLNGLIPCRVNGTSALAGSGGEVLRDARSGELCAVGKAAEGPEAGCGGEAYEVKAGDGGLEVGVENGDVFEGLHLAAQIGIKKAESVQLHFVAGCRNDVIDVKVLRRAVAVREMQVSAVGVF